MPKTVVTYEVDGLLYSVEEEEEVHNRLQEDGAYVEEYFDQNSPECIGISEDVGNQGEFQWTEPATKFFLDEYQQRKDKFRDPTIKKKKLWSEILKKMRLAGFGVSSIETLDSKMRNLKRRFKTIKQNKKSTGRSRLEWRYTRQMEEIFSTDCTINFPPTLASLKERDCVAGPPTAPSTFAASPNSPRPCTPPPMSASSANGSPPVISNENDETVAESAAEAPSTSKPTSLYSMRKSQLQIEERKARASEKVIEKMAEANRILRMQTRLLKERNTLLRELVQLKKKTG